MQYLLTGLEDSIAGVKATINNNWNKVNMQLPHSRGVQRTRYFGLVGQRFNELDECCLGISGRQTSCAVDTCVQREFLWDFAAMRGDIPRSCVVSSDGSHDTVLVAGGTLAA